MNRLPKTNEQGERYKGKPFKGRSFDKWMLNEKYTGEFTFGGRCCDNMYPAVDKDLFERVGKDLRQINIPQAERQLAQTDKKN